MNPAFRVASLTAIAMLAFAANSLLCRLALGQGSIDAASFTSVRAVAGALTLGLIVFTRGMLIPAPTLQKITHDWRMAAGLFTYMVFFSFAYRSLGAGTGALILFGSVQLTMFAFALRSGEHFPLASWAGFTLAVAGLIYLVSPGLAAPDPIGAALMVVAGIAWGFYSLLGRGVADPLQATAKNFAACMPLVLIVSVVFLDHVALSTVGIILAAASGAIASGCGYVVWYAALPGLSAARAATVQLSVPVIAAFGGVIFLSEQITLRLLLASAATLGGVAIVLLQRASRPAKA